MPESWDRRRGEAFVTKLYGRLELLFTFHYHYPASVSPDKGGGFDKSAVYSFTTPERKEHHAAFFVIMERKEAVAPPPPRQQAPGPGPSDGRGVV
jgi:hypothetical protein